MPKSSIPGGWVAGWVAGWLGGWVEKLRIKLTQPSLVELGLLKQLNILLIHGQILVLNKIDNILSSKLLNSMM